VPIELSLQAIEHKSGAFSRAGPHSVRYSKDFLGVEERDDQQNESNFDQNAIPDRPKPTSEMINAPASLRSDHRCFASESVSAFLRLRPHERAKVLSCHHEIGAAAARSSLRRSTSPTHSTL